MDADAIELRVLGCLIEKQRTTPEAYPLSLNALRLACNQSTNRDPVVDYDEPTIRAALDRLAQKRLDAARERAGQPRGQVPAPVRRRDRRVGRRDRRALRADAARAADARRAEAANSAAACVRRTSTDIERVLDGLIERELVARLPRRPGQKEQRYEHLLGGDAPREEPARAVEDDDRLTELEHALTELKDEVAALRSELASLRRQRED